MALVTPLKELLFRGQTIAVSIIGRTCAFESKNRIFFGDEKVVTAYAVRDKKNFKNLTNLQKLPTDLIEK